VAEKPVTARGEQHAYVRIRQAIVEGRYRPGQRLIEQRIGEELEVSRTPVREALRMLEAEGLVTSLRNRGAVVRPLTPKDIIEVYDLRVRLESLAAERAATLGTPEQVANLEEANDEFGDAIPTVISDDLEVLRRLNAANRRFHQGLVDMADSWRLAHLLARTVDAVLVFQGFRSYGLAELERSVLFHRLITRSVESKEAERAGHLMAEHIMLGRDALLDNIDNEALVNSAIDAWPDDPPSSDGAALSQ
jgi:DNA-binding GntR family transcriptional regulator